MGSRIWGCEKNLGLGPILSFEKRAAGVPLVIYTPLLTKPESHSGGVGAVKMGLPLHYNERHDLTANLTANTITSNKNQWTPRHEEQAKLLHNGRPQTQRTPYIRFRDQGVGGSNPLAPTIYPICCQWIVARSGTGSETGSAGLCPILCPP